MMQGGGMMMAGKPEAEAEPSFLLRGLCRRFRGLWNG